MPEKQGGRGSNRQPRNNAPKKVRPGNRPARNNRSKSKSSGQFRARATGRARNAAKAALPPKAMEMVWPGCLAPNQAETDPATGVDPVAGRVAGTAIKMLVPVRLNLPDPMFAG